MAQKVNPISLRLQQTNREFDNCWYTDYFYRKLVSRDIYLQQYINSFLKLVKCPSARYSIQYSIKTLKLYNFLCYPKQSREIRSKMFGLSFRKKPKKYLKKRMSFLETKAKSSISLSFFSKKNKKNQKTLKFLVNNYLWSHVWTTLTTSKKSIDRTINKRDDSILKNKKTRTLYRISLNNTYNTIVSRMYTKKNIINFIHSIDYSSLIKQAFSSLNSKKLKTNGSVNLLKNTGNPRYQNGENSSLFLSSGLEKNSFSKKKSKILGLPFYFENLGISNKYQGESLEILKINPNFKKTRFGIPLYSYSRVDQKKKYLYFLQNFRIALISKKLINQLISRKQDNKHFIQNTDPLYFNLEYKKILIKYFLVFYSLYKQFNKNTISPASINYDSSINKDSLMVYGIKKDNTLMLNQEIPEWSKIENVLNQLKCLYSFQPISIFHSAFENKKLHDLLSNNFILTNQLSRQIPVNKQINSVFYDLKNNKSQLKFKNNIQKICTKQYNINTEFVPFVVSQDWQNAGFFADEIVYFLERRIAFQRLKTRIIKKIAENSNIRGIRISFSGRVGGKSKKAQRAKTKCVKYGQTSRHTFSSRLDFAARTARTSFGTVGIKVWICYV